jgi:Ion transport protein
MAFVAGTAARTGFQHGVNAPLESESDSDTSSGRLDAPLGDETESSDDNANANNGRVRIVADDTPPLPGHNDNNDDDDDDDDKDDDGLKPKRGLDSGDGGEKPARGISAGGKMGRTVVFDAASGQMRVVEDVNRLVRDDDGVDVPDEDSDGNESSDWDAELPEKEFVYAKTVMPKPKIYDTNFKRLRRMTWRLFDDPFSSPLAKVIGATIMSLILFSTFTFMIETVPRFYNQPGYTYWLIIESIVVGMFTVEFLCRLFSTPDYRKYIKNGMNWVDFLAVLPYYIEIVAGSAPGLTVIRVIRLTRIFRIFKLGRYSQSFSLILGALSKSVEALIMLFLFISMGMILSSSLIYFAEQFSCEFIEDEELWVYTDDHLDVGFVAGDPTTFQSIPHSLWWSITTITTGMCNRKRLASKLGD